MNSCVYIAAVYISHIDTVKHSIYDDNKCSKHSDCCNSFISDLLCNKGHFWQNICDLICERDHC